MTGLMAPEAGPTILTASGQYFHLRGPMASEVSAQDIGHALAHVCRFSGHTRTFYSVAQHSVLVSRVCPPHYALDGLLHDASEAYLGDVTAPLKRLLPEYRMIEARIEKFLALHFGVAWPMPAEVKHADRVLLATEQRDLMPPNTKCDDLTGIAPMSEPIVPWCADEARQRWLERLGELRVLRSHVWNGSAEEG